METIVDNIVLRSILFVSSCFWFLCRINLSLINFIDIQIRLDYWNGELCKLRINKRKEFCALYCPWQSIANWDTLQLGQCNITHHIKLEFQQHVPISKRKRKEQRGDSKLINKITRFPDTFINNEMTIDIIGNYLGLARFAFGPVRFFLKNKINDKNYQLIEVLFNVSETHDKTMITAH